VVAGVALSFHLFGIGVWQGRLPGLFYTFGALSLVWFLANRLYGRRIALGSLGILLLASGAQQIHPILVGRQVLGEMPAMFFLLSGYALLYLTLRKSYLVLFPAVLFCGLALETKAQVLPFWVFSLMLPLIIALHKRWGKTSLALSLGLLGGWYARFLVRWFHGMVLPPNPVSREPIVNLFQISALVPDISVRIAAALTVFMFALPALCGYLWVVWKFWKEREWRNSDSSLFILKSALFSLGGIWMCWYLLLGMSWTRYLFPTAFIGSIFAAKFIHDLSGGYNPRYLIREASKLILQSRVNRSTVSSLFIIILVSMTVPVTFNTLIYSYTQGSDHSVFQVVDYLNRETPPDALIETYDSELFFLLERRYHYPPDQSTVGLISATYLGGDPFDSYNPLELDPDYLVIGPMSREWGLYDQVINGGKFVMTLDTGRYQIYQHNRDRTQ
jgi:hypothetical protein